MFSRERHGGFDHLREDSNGFRARKGQIEPVVLEVLLDGSMHGYDIIAAIEEKSNGLWKPSAGSIYPALSLFTESGLVTVEEEKNKKNYTLTEEGMHAAGKARRKNQAFWKRVGQMSRKNMRQKMELFHIMQLIKTIGDTGSEEQKQRGYELMVGIREDLEAILYDEDFSEEGVDND